MKDKEFEERLHSLSKMYVLKREVKERIMREIRKTEISKRTSLGIIFAVLVSLIVLIIVVPFPSYLTDSSYLIGESEFIGKFILYLENIEIFQWMLVQILLYLTIAFVGLFSIVLINKMRLKGGRR
ncbi:MAG: hypothetical protein DRI28_02455 [Caldiserica bacterium]|nr:MAG: hypothetical protein DRI28_02455 [Caldisericota bacterium]